MAASSYSSILTRIGEPLLMAWVSILRIPTECHQQWTATRLKNCTVFRDSRVLATPRCGGLRLLSVWDDTL